MFRKIAIALVAASVLTAPVLAQGTTPGDSKVSPTTPAPTASTTEKSEKAVTKATKHRGVARHPRLGTKMANYPNPPVTTTLNPTPPPPPILCNVPHAP